MGFNSGKDKLTDLDVDDGTLSVDETNNRVGIGTTSPGTQIQVESTAPYITLKNSTAENTAAGCESRIIFEDHGNNSLGLVEVSHVGTSDDEKGQMIFKTNNDSGLQTALTISEAQLATFAGAVTVGGALTVDSVGVSAIQTSAESFADNDTSLMTSAAIDDRINTATTLDFSGLSAVTPTVTDSFATLDSDGSTEQRTTITALATLMAPTNTLGLTNASGQVKLQFASVAGATATLAANDSVMTMRFVGSGNQRTPVSDVAALFAGAGLTATSAVIAVDAAQAITSVTADLTVAGGDLILGATAVAGTVSGVAAAADTAGNAVTIQGGSALAGNSANTGVGGAVVIQGGAGKGTAAGGSIVFKSATAGGSGTALNSINDTILTLASDLSATFTGAVAATGFTAGTNVITDDSIVMTPSTDDTVTIAAATNGALNITTVDNAAHGADLTLTVDGDTIMLAEGTSVARAVGTATSSTTNVTKAFSALRPYIVMAADTQLYAGDSGAIIVFSDADGAIATLPDSGTAANVGCTFTFLIKVTATTNAHKIVCTDTTNEVIFGQVHSFLESGGFQTTKAFNAGGSTSALIFNGTTTGGIYSEVTLTAVAADSWVVTNAKAVYVSGTQATPFADS